MRAGTPQSAPGSPARAAVARVGVGRRLPATAPGYPSPAMAGSPGWFTELPQTEEQVPL